MPSRLSIAHCSLVGSLWKSFRSALGRRRLRTFARRFVWRHDAVKFLQQCLQRLVGSDLRYTKPMTFVLAFRFEVLDRQLADAITFGTWACFVAHRRHQPWDGASSPRTICPNVSRA